VADVDYIEGRPSQAIRLAEVIADCGVIEEGTVHPEVFHGCMTALWSGE
jgi:hypothetical protein